jgi:protein O-GlcNAc transferase
VSVGIPRFSPSERDARLAQGVAAHAQGRLDEAAGAYVAVLRGDPLDADALNLLGRVHMDRGDYGRAFRALSGAVAADPGFADAVNHHALALMHLGHPVPALRMLLRAMAIRPDVPEVHSNCGGVLFELAEWEQAVGCYDRALALRPDYADAHVNRANTLQLMGRLEDSRLAYARALALTPQRAEALSGLASVDQAEGVIALAVRGFRRAMAARPDAWVHSNLIFCLSYDGQVSCDGLFAEYRRWEATQAVPVYRANRPVKADPDPERRLRVGWLSGDFREHPVGRNVLGAIERRDRAGHEAILYGNITTADAVTERFKAAADAWRDVAGLPDDRVAEIMRADRLDLLIVLAGHTGRNRIAVAARRPAPVQVSFHDLSTSGLSVMDAWLTDAVLHPETTRERFTERLIRLPCFYLHEPPAEAPDPGPLPANSFGAITFGSCNNTSKHTPEVLALWAEVLRAVPGSRLLLKYLNRYASGRLRARIAGVFAEHGVSADRLLFLTGNVPRREQLALLRQVDIALDPFPFNGSTTTFEALWMGVPVVTLAGDRFLGRVGASVLHQIGLDDLVANDAADYVERARALASDLPRLAALRAGLRARVAASPLCDAEGYAAALDAALRGLWRAWCRGR